MIGELIHCDPALIDSAETYRLYLQAVRDVCSFFLSERGGVHCGDMGCGGGGVACDQLSAEARNIKSVRGFLENGGDRGGKATGVDGAFGAVETSSTVPRRGGAEASDDFRASLDAGVGSSDCRCRSGVRGVSCGAGRADQAGRVIAVCASEQGAVAARAVDLKPESAFVREGDVVSGSSLRGPNWARNRAAREKRKRQRQNKEGAWRATRVEQAAVGSVGRGYSSPTDGAGSECASAVRDSTRVDQEGFWNSCSAEVRQELIDSKARMHIAENLRKAKKAEEEVKQMESPEALLVRAMGMVSMAERCAKKKNDSKVAGWAETVATSYAESIAKSAPSSVPSYASVLSGSSATSVSVDGTKRKKPQAPVKEKEPSVGQIVASYGARLAESRTLADLDGILTDVVDEPKISGGNMNKILNVLEEKRRKFQRVAERVDA